VSFADRIAARVEVLFSQEGTAATYLYEGGESEVTAIVRDDLAADPTVFEAPLRTGQHVIDLLASEVGGADDVERGEILRIGATEYHIDRVVSADGLITRVVCSDRSG
jgi:hypothetical protein